MNLLYLKDRDLSSKASELVRFDMDSIRQVVAAHHAKDPEVWMADPDQYERNGRILRDSSTPRLLAYSTASRRLYVTDGCNTCAHDVVAELMSLNTDQLHQFADRNKIPFELLQRLAAHCAE